VRIVSGKKSEKSVAHGRSSPRIQEIQGNPNSSSIEYWELQPFATEIPEICDDGQRSSGVRRGSEFPLWPLNFLDLKISIYRSPRIPASLHLAAG
jgi:hypothetical protein